MEINLQLAKLLKMLLPTINVDAVAVNLIPISKDDNSKASIMRLNGHRLWAHVKEIAFGSGRLRP